jgi:histidine triad (HIT) family protein
MQFNVRRMSFWVAGAALLFMEATKVYRHPSGFQERLEVLSTAAVAGAFGVGSMRRPWVFFIVLIVFWALSPKIDHGLQPSDPLFLGWIIGAPVGWAVRYFNRRELMSADTIFSRIVKGEISAAKVLETDRALAFLDISPVNHGHVLLIPKEPYPSIDDLPDDLAAHLASLLPRLSRAVRKATGAEGINVVVNNGEAAGQTIFHVHFHIIPRFHGDPVRWPWPHQPYEEGALEAMRAKVEKALNSGE